MKARWLEAARQDRRDIIGYVAGRNVEAALRIDERIMQGMALLEHHPFAGRIGRIPGTRELVITGSRFIAVYRVDGETPVVVRLIHMSRDWPLDV